MSRLQTMVMDCKPVPCLDADRHRKSWYREEPAPEYLVTLGRQCTPHLLVTHPIRARTTLSRRRPFILCAFSAAMRLPILLLGTVWRLSKVAAHVPGRPSSFVKTTSVGMHRIVNVMGAIVTEFTTDRAESRVRINTARVLSGVFKEYRHTSPRFTRRPSLAR